MKLDFSKLGKSAGIDISKAMSGGQLEPTDMLSMLEAEGAEVQKVGPATIDGVATTHYRVKVDLAKALQSKGLSSPMLKDFASKMKTATDERLDRQGRPRPPDPVRLRHGREASTWP